MRKLTSGELLHLPGGVVPLGAHRDDQEDRGLLGQREQSLRELDRRRIGPVQVVDGHHHGTVFSQAGDQGAHHLERPVLEGFGRKLCQAGRGVGLQRDAEHCSEIGIELECALREQ